MRLEATPLRIFYCLYAHWNAGGAGRGGCFVFDSLIPIVFSDLEPVTEFSNS